MKRSQRTWIWVLASGMSTMLLFLCFRRLQWAGLWREFGDARLSWLAMAVTAHLLIFAFWGAQWKTFLPRGYRIPFGRMFEINAVMAMVSNTVPLLAGHALGVVLLVKRERVDSAAALSVMALDQMTKGLVKLFLFLVLALFSPLPDWMREKVLLLVLGVWSLSATLLFLAYRYRNPDVSCGNPSRKAFHSLRSFIGRWAHHLEALRSFRSFSIGLLMAFAMKGAEGAAVLAIQEAFHLALPFWSVLFILAALSIVTMVPLTPGNLGAYEATVFFIYQLLGVPPEKALSVALFQHLCYLLPMVGTGYGFVLAGRFFPGSSPLRTSGAPSTGRGSGRAAPSLASRIRKWFGRPEVLRKSGKQ